MIRRWLALLTAAVVAAAAGAVLPLATAPAGAAVVGYTLSAVDGTGLLDLRESEEPYVLESPTTFNGSVDDATGDITASTFSTPPVSFETVALGLPVDVVATFTEVTPGTATGSLNGDGVLVLRDSLRVTLDLDINNGTLLTTCTTSPVQIELISTTPYTNETGGTVRDADFTIPEFADDGTCHDQVIGPLNDLLAGSGNSLTMRVDGDLELPVPGDPTSTTLAVTPAGGVTIGNEVTLAATVAPTEASTETPSGPVEFFDGTRSLGTAIIDAGTATLVTSDLRAGTRSVTARYLGDANFRGSTSDPVSYLVSSVPTIESNLPEEIVRGAAAVEFDVVVENPAEGRALANGRIDVGISYTDPSTPNVGQVVLERQLPDDSWVTVPLTRFGTGAPRPGGDTGGALLGTLDAASTGEPLAAGASRTERLRISATSAVGVRDLLLWFDLEEVDPSTGAEVSRVAQSSGTTAVVLEDRQPTTTSVFSYDTMHRPGYSSYVEVLIDSNPMVDQGSLEVYLDGQRVNTRITPGFGPEVPASPTQAVTTSSSIVLVDIPIDMAPGVHTLSARYLGGRSFAPSLSEPFEIEVSPARGVPYQCVDTSLLVARFVSYFEAYTVVPSVRARGTNTTLSEIDLTMYTGGFDTPSYLVNWPNADSITVDLGEAGEASGEAIAYESNYVTSEQTVEFQGLSGSLAITGDPGDVISVDIDSVTLEGDALAGRFTAVCEPIPEGEATHLGDITVAGATLEVQGGDPTRVGDSVTLTSHVAPVQASGVVQFFDGLTLIGQATPVDGVATLVTSELAEGAHSLTAQYRGGFETLTSESETIDIEAAVECGAFDDEGDGRVVRLVYMELLRRCPDQSGYDYWVDQLESGVSDEDFALTIAYTNEALDRVIDDAYETVLDRLPSTADRNFWRERFKQKGFKYQQLLAELAASDEFFAASGRTRAGLVTRVYDRILHRAPSASDLDYWEGELLKGLSRSTVMLTVAGLREPMGVIVDQSYDEILSVVPGTAERDLAITTLQKTGDRSALYADLIGDPRFRARAQDLPNPED